MKREAQGHLLSSQYSVASKASPWAGTHTSTLASAPWPSPLRVHLAHHPHLALAAQIQKPSSFSAGCVRPPQRGSWSPCVCRPPGKTDSTGKLRVPSRRRSASACTNSGPRMAPHGTQHHGAAPQTCYTACPRPRPRALPLSTTTRERN